MSELSKAVWDHLNHPPPYAKNLSEWAKREACWTTLREKPHLLLQLRGRARVGCPERWTGPRACSVNFSVVATG